MYTCAPSPCIVQMDVFDAAERYKQEGRQLILLAGKDYGLRLGHKGILVSDEKVIKLWNLDSIYVQDKPE